MNDPLPDYCYNAKITRVIDGDTYDVIVDLGFRVQANLPLRLAHVDAPERNTADGKAVINYLSVYFGAGMTPVVVHTYKPIDKYGRYLADVYIPYAGGFLNLGEDLLERGLVKPYEGGKKE